MLSKETFEINSTEHRKAQRISKIRNLAKGNKNPAEKAAAERKAGGPKLVGENQQQYEDFKQFPEKKVSRKIQREKDRLSAGALAGSKASGSQIQGRQQQLNRKRAGRIMKMSRAMNSKTSTSYDERLKMNSSAQKTTRTVDRIKDRQTGSDTSKGRPRRWSLEPKLKDKKKEIKEVWGAVAKVALSAGKGMIKQKAKQVVKQKAANVVAGAIPQPNRDQQNEGVGRAAIGAGVGALVGGPVGAAAGAAIGASLGKKKVTSGGEKVKKKATNFFKAEPKVTSSEGVVSFVKKGLDRDKKAKEKKKIKDRKAVPYAALAAEHQPEGELVDEKFATQYTEAKVDTVKKLDDEGKEDARNLRKYGTKHNQFMQAVRRRGEHRSERGVKQIKGQKPAPKGAYGEDWKPEITHSKLGDATKKAAEKKKKEAQKGLPPHLQGDWLGKARKAFKENYRVLAKDKGEKGKPAQFSYKDEKDANKFADSIKKDGGKVTVTKEEVGISSSAAMEKARKEAELKAKEDAAIKKAKKIKESRMDREPPSWSSMNPEDEGNPEYEKTQSYEDEQKWKKKQQKKKLKKEEMSKGAGVSESKATAKLAAKVLKDKKPCNECGSVAHITGQCPKKDHDVSEGVMDIVNRYKKKKEEKKPQKAQDAGARARRVLKRREYQDKVSVIVPAELEDQKVWDKIKSIW